MLKDPLQAKLKEMEERNPSTTKYNTSLGERLYFLGRKLLGSVVSADETYKWEPTGEKEFQQFQNSSNRSYKEINYDYQALRKAVELFSRNENYDGLGEVVKFVLAEIPDLENHGSWYLNQRKIVGLHFAQTRDELIETLYAALYDAGNEDLFPKVRRLKSDVDCRQRALRLKNKLMDDGYRGEALEIMLNPLGAEVA